MTTATVTQVDGVRPSLRGWLHALTVPIAVPAAILLDVHAQPRLRGSVTVYGVTTVLIFSVSAIYHRLAWPTRFRSWWQRADHSTIFLFIVGTYTPVAVVSFRSTWSWLLLTLMWATGLTGVAIIWLLGIRGVVGWLYMALGWSGLAVLAPFMAHAGVAATALLLVGGLAYTAGAMMSRFRRPNPWPNIFGYHEIFHAMTLVAAVCQYIAVTIAVSAHA